MATRSVEKELVDLERQFWQALKDKDQDTVTRLSDDTTIVTGPQGIGSIDKQQLAAMVANPSYTLNDFQIGDDVKVRMIGDDVALLAYKVHERMTVEGKPIELDAAEASTWVRRDGSWVCALHCESLTGDPFGRDRRPTR